MNPDSWIDSFARWCQRAAPRLMRAAVAVIFLWFGLLKLCGRSPAAGLVSDTFFFLPPAVAVPALGASEVVIGLCFVLRRFLGVGVALLLLHLPGTFLSFLVVPERCFAGSLFVLTTEGEFIVKNLLLISGACFLAGTLARPPAGSRAGTSP